MESRRDRASSANSRSCAAESFTLAGDTGGLSTKTPGSVVSCVLPTVAKLAATSVATNIPIRIIHPPLGGHSYPAKRRAVQKIRVLYGLVYEKICSERDRPFPVRFRYMPLDFTKMWGRLRQQLTRSEEHTSELQSLMRISYAVFCL